MPRGCRIADTGCNRLLVDFLGSELANSSRFEPVGRLELFDLLFEGLMQGGQITNLKLALSFFGSRAHVKHQQILRRIEDWNFVLGSAIRQPDALTLICKSVREPLRIKFDWVQKSSLKFKT